MNVTIFIKNLPYDLEFLLAFLIAELIALGTSKIYK